MSFSVDEELDLEELFQDIKIPDKNMYISDENKAIELISDLIKNKTNTSLEMYRRIEKQIDEMFSIFSEVPFKNELLLYERFKSLCLRLSKVNKIQKIQDKVVISFGGKVSAGKSKFINSISEIDNMLPVAQETTTAIPTYIIKSKEDKISVNSMYGYTIDITPEALNAMAHEFDDVYGIGFPAFVDSIIIESKKYSLNKEIALLDTPGYTKYDEKSDSKMIISDRQRAFEQLSISDYLIWLIDIDNGAITQDDLDFIKTLKIKTPILIVFTKADLKVENEIKEIIKCAEETIKDTSINCFGITAYSSNQKKEYGNNLIKKFLEFTIKGNVRNNDITAEFQKVEQEMKKEIIEATNSSRNTAKKLFNYIKTSDKIMEIQSLASLWGKANQKSYKMEKLLKQYDKHILSINNDIKKYIKEGDKSYD